MFYYSTFKKVKILILFLGSDFEIDPNQLEDSPSHIIVSGRPNRTKQPPNKPVSQNHSKLISLFNQIFIL